MSKLMATYITQQQLVENSRQKTLESKVYYFENMKIMSQQWQWSTGELQSSCTHPKSSSPAFPNTSPRFDSVTATPSNIQLPFARLQRPLVVKVT